MLHITLVIISRIHPEADNFTFVAPDNLTYNGEAKAATVQFNDENNKLSGMGDITVNYYSDSNCTKEISQTNVKDAGIYYVGISVNDKGSNYTGKETLTVQNKESGNWNFTIAKTTPEADNFTFAKPDNLIYDGKAKVAQVKFNNEDGKLTGIGEITVKYYSDSNCTTEISANKVKDAGIYYVGISVDNTGNNYTGKETLTVQNKESGNWNFTIQKAEPKASNFTFVAPDNLIYNGEAKAAEVKFDDENGKLTGMGKIDIYYKEGEYESEDNVTNKGWKQIGNDVPFPSDAGTYCFGISVAAEPETDENSNYEPAESLVDPTWTYTIEQKVVTELPEVSTFDATYGQTLQDLTFSESDLGTWAWSVPDTKLTTVGENQPFDAIFTPADIKNYDWSKIKGYENGEIHTQLTVNVGKANLGEKDITIDSTKAVTKYDGTDKDLKSIVKVPDGLKSYTFEYLKDGSTTWTAGNPKNAGTYKIKLVVKDDEHYDNGELELDGQLKINKATLKAENFTFEVPKNLTYDGTKKKQQ